MASGDGNRRQMKSNRSLLAVFLMTPSLERMMMMRRSKPTLCWVLWDCCYSNLSDWKCLDLSRCLQPTVPAPFQHLEPEYFGNSVVHRHLKMFDGKEKVNEIIQTEFERELNKRKFGSSQSRRKKTKKNKKMLRERSQ